MIRLYCLAMAFLKNSKMLSVSAFLSIFFACFLSISMFQLSSGAKSAYETGISLQYGNFQIGVSKEKEEAFTKEEAGFIKRNKGITNVASGYCLYMENGIYAAGVIDNNINRSKYKYNYAVNGNNVAVNSYLSTIYNIKEGESISLPGKDYIVKEVFEDNSSLQSGRPVLVMDMAELHSLLGNKDASCANYFLLQCDSKETENIIHRLEQYKASFLVDSPDREKKKLFVVFEKMIDILFVIVILVSGLFIVSIFNEYMRKYHRDMAVIRVAGGSREQVWFIFISMSVTLGAFGCIAGTVASILFDSTILNIFNKKAGFFKGDIVTDWNVVLIIPFVVFILLNLMVMFLFVCRQNILPAEVFQRTQAGLRKNKKMGRFLGLRRLLGTEAYLGIKLLIPKFWQNILIILIIALITAFSYTGQSSMYLLLENNNVYYRDLMHGSDAYAEMSLSNIPNIRNALNIAGQIQKNSLDCCMVLEGFQEKGFPGNKLWGFNITDMGQFVQWFKGQRLKNWDKVPKEQRIVITEGTAKLTGYRLGSHITLDSKWTGGRKDFTVIEIAEWDYSIQDEYGIFLDKDSINYVKEDTGEYGFSGEAYFFINGNDNIAEKVLKEIGIKTAGFKWKIYNQVIKSGNEVTGQRLAMIKAVLFILMLVSGIGWLNSAKGLLLARKKEYQVLRLSGVTENGTKIICFIQIWLYMLAGIVSGVLTGLVFVYIIWKNNLNPGVEIIFYWQNIAGIIIFFIVLSLMLYPAARRISVLENNLA